MRRALAMALVLGPVAVVVACGGDEHYVYTARKLELDAACLDPYKSIDFVNGDSVSSKCAPNCFEYGGETFTSTMCPPLPALATALDAEAPECKLAVTLYGATCGGDAASAYDGGGGGGDQGDAGQDALDASDAADQ